MEEKIKEESYPKKFVEWFVSKGQFTHRFLRCNVLQGLDDAYSYWITTKSVTTRDLQDIDKANDERDLKKRVEATRNIC